MKGKLHLTYRDNNNFAITLATILSIVLFTAPSAYSAIATFQFNRSPNEDPCSEITDKHAWLRCINLLDCIDTGGHWVNNECIYCEEGQRWIGNKCVNVITGWMIETFPPQVEQGCTPVEDSDKGDLPTEEDSELPEQILPTESGC